MTAKMPKVILTEYGLYELGVSSGITVVLDDIVPLSEKRFRGNVMPPTIGGCTRLVAQMRQ